MSAVRLAKPADLDRLMPLVAGFHAHCGFKTDETHRQNALLPLLEGSPLGAIYMIGPNSAPVGYLAISFGWSIEFGGIEVTLDEFYVRERVRGRGMGSEALRSLIRVLQQYGVVAMALELNTLDATAQALYQRIGFDIRDNYSSMSYKF